MPDASDTKDQGDPCGHQHPLSTVTRVTWFLCLCNFRFSFQNQDSQVEYQGENFSKKLKSLITTPEMNTSTYLNHTINSKTVQVS